MKDNMTIEEASKIIDAATREQGTLRAFDIAVARILRDQNISQDFRKAVAAEETTRSEKETTHE